MSRLFAGKLIIVRDYTRGTQRSASCLQRACLLRKPPGRDVSCSSMQTLVRARQRECPHQSEPHPNQRRVRAATSATHHQQVMGKARREGRSVGQQSASRASLQCTGRPSCQRLANWPKSASCRHVKAENASLSKRPWIAAHWPGRVRSCWLLATARTMHQSCTLQLVTKLDAARVSHQSSSFLCAPCSSVLVCRCRQSRRQRH